MESGWEDFGQGEAKRELANDIRVIVERTDKGHRAYVVCPRKERDKSVDPDQALPCEPQEGDDSESKAKELAWAYLRARLLNELVIDVPHGTGPAIQDF